MKPWMQKVCHSPLLYAPSITEVSELALAPDGGRLVGRFFATEVSSAVNETLPPFTPRLSSRFKGSTDEPHAVLPFGAAKV